MIRLSHDECNVLMHGLKAADSQDLALTDQARATYAGLVNRIIDVGTGYDAGDITAYLQWAPNEYGDTYECDACGYVHQFTHDGPHGNGWEFCPECGRKITAVVPWSEQERGGGE